MSQIAVASKTTSSKGSATPASATKSVVQSQVFVSPQLQILQFHQQYGNRAVQRMFEAGQLQAKLKIGQPNDKYEQEADRVADQVMSMPERQVRTKPG